MFANIFGGGNKGVYTAPKTYSTSGDSTVIDTNKMWSTTPYIREPTEVQMPTMDATSIRKLMDLIEFIETDSELSERWAVYQAEKKLRGENE